MFTYNGDANSWGSRRTFLLAMLCQLLGMPIFVLVANSAGADGATGFILSHSALCVVVGIPLVYMELIIGQFTARDCIDVWKVRPCVSHIGYILVFWQVIQILYNHATNSFIFHYLLISFENPIPYFTCGSWSDKNCNLLIYNYTVHHDCMKEMNLQDQPIYCDYLYTTFPEYQYWRYKILGRNEKTTYHIARRVCLASGLLCAVTYLSVFKGKRSVKWVLTFFTIYPIACYMALFMGSMLQKGVVTKYYEAIDFDFSVFVENFSLSRVVGLIVLNLRIGSGVTFNMACSSEFRGPCYSNAVLSVVIFAAVVTLAICICAMMICPYALEHAVSTKYFWDLTLSSQYEKTPRLLFEYNKASLWLIITYSAHTVLGAGTNIILLLHLLEMVSRRFRIVAKYPGLASFVGIVWLFFLTIPILCATGITTLKGLKRNSHYINMFVAILECLVFVIWYGLDKFSEDVHFMQGLQPKKYMRIGWLLATILLIYTLCCDIWTRTQKKARPLGDTIGWYIFMATVVLIVIIIVIKLLIGLCKNKFNEVIRLDPTWGPKSEILQRSRAMFSAQAMTKEYLYRQYHLQAGILARQKMANCRTLDRDLQSN